MDWIWTALLSLVSGSVGSVVFAQTAGRRAEIAKARYQATSRLQVQLRTYRQELKYQHGRAVTEQHGYPPEFAAIAGQEQLARDVLEALSDLQRKTEIKLVAELNTLVGETVLNHARSRTYIPQATINPSVEQGRLELALRRVNSEPDRYSDGLLPRLLSQQNAQDLQDYLTQALATLARMILLAKP